MTFSVLIPAYKATYLKECINSVLTQTFTDFEVVIVDDASPENIKSIVNSFSDNRIRYYRNDINYGALNVVDNWNKCLEYALGDFVICMGDDDRLLPICLEKYSSMINDYPDVDVFHARTQIINERSIVKDVQEPRPIIESVYSMMYYRWKGRMQFIGDFLYRTKTLKEMGGFYFLPMAWGSDDITAYIMAKEKGIVNSQDFLFQYRISETTLTNSGNPTIKLKAIKLQEEWTESFLSQKPLGEEDLVLWKKILKFDISNHFNEKRCAALFFDYSKYGIWRIIYWLFFRKQYYITITQIWLSWKSYIRYRIKVLLKKDIYKI